MGSIIMFTPPSDQKIINKEKVMTARYWLKKPPKIGAVVHAQTGRKKETAFAKLKITDVFRWHIGVNFNIFFWNEELDFWESPTNKVRDRIGIKEGFDSWQSFLNAYHSLNAHHFGSLSKRQHYFIEFELLEVVDGR